jgi:hypothetical protein
MNNSSTMLACGSMDLGPGITTIVYGVVAYWVVGIVSALINLFFIGHFCYRGASNYFKIISIVILLAYTVPAIGLFYGWPDDASTAIPVTLMLPLFSISHLIYFVCISWKRKKNGEKI